MGGLLKVMGFIFVLLIVAQMLPKTPTINQAQTGRAMTEDEIAKAAASQGNKPPTEAEILKARKEAEDRCPDPAKCREANRKAYGAVGGWNYTTRKDEMRGTDVTTASIYSPKRLEFPFPYAGGSTAELYLVKSQSRTSIGLQIERGHLLCHGTGDSEVKVKFDDGKVQDFRCVHASDGSANVLFIQPEARFLSALKASKKVLIEVEFYQQGTRQIPFNTAGLNWK